MANFLEGKGYLVSTAGVDEDLIRRYFQHWRYF